MDGTPGERLNLTHAAYKDIVNVEKLRRALAAKSVDLGNRGRDSVFGRGFVKSEPMCAK